MVRTSVYPCGLMRLHEPLARAFGVSRKRRSPSLVLELSLPHLEVRALTSRVHPLGKEDLIPLGYTSPLLLPPPNTRLGVVVGRTPEGVLQAQDPGCPTLGSSATGGSWSTGLRAFPVRISFKYEVYFIFPRCN